MRKKYRKVSLSLYAKAEFYIKIGIKNVPAWVGSEGDVCYGQTSL